jgi:hypothetical protein
MPLTEAIPTPVPILNPPLGRLPRTHNPHIPKLDRLLASATPPPAPDNIDYTLGLPVDLGMMLNNTLNDCSCAAFYHARQVWTFNATGKLLEIPDTHVKLLYQQACGYDPTQPGPGPGGCCQAVLTHLLQSGAPCGDKLIEHEKIAAFVEVNHCDIPTIKHIIADCGVCYVGIRVPHSLTMSGEPVPAVWDYNPAVNNMIVGGHAVVLAGYDEKTLRVISWGQLYTMTWNFFLAFVDEAYAIVHRPWIDAKHNTPGHLPPEQLAAAMLPLLTSPN